MTLKAFPTENEIKPPNIGLTLAMKQFCHRYYDKAPKENEDHRNALDLD